VILLALDSCDPRGSLALLRDDEVLQKTSHETQEDYSSWLLPAVARLLQGCGLAIEQVDVYGVATGPGSFTGVRVGLTTVKAWSEVYLRQIAAVSRLEAIAAQAEQAAGLVAAFTDAHREQIFGALYRRKDRKLELVDEEMVIEPGKFLEWVAERTGKEPVTWVSTDADRMTHRQEWVARDKMGEKLQRVSPILAPAIGKIGFAMAKEGRLIDALRLDANYVRRSDAEIFWKGAATHGR
jgi:tRNA threonylcarbamoyladenosine biosynthesis protein TsaB